MDPFFSSVDTNRSTKKSFFLSIIFLILILSAIPLGVYVVQQQTNLAPKAANKTQQPVLKSAKLSMSSDKLNLKTGEEFTALVLVESPEHEANLFSSQIKFPADLIEVTKLDVIDVPKDFYNFNKTNHQKKIIQHWIEKKYDNTLGIISLVGGVGTPGVKTEPGKPSLITRVNFKTKNPGEALLQFDERSLILENFSNSNILSKTDNLKVNIDSQEELTCQVRPSCLDETPKCKVTEPKQGFCPPSPEIKITTDFKPRIYNSDESIPIEWSLNAVENVTIGLLRNGEYLGNIISLPAQITSFEWKPNTNLNLIQTTPISVYQLVIFDSNKTDVLGMSEVPFQILNSSFCINSGNSTGQVCDKEVILNQIIYSADKLEKGQGDFNKDNNINLTDFSILLSKFNYPSTSYKDLDLNKDGFLNPIDLWLLKQIQEKNI